MHVAVIGAGAAGLCAAKRITAPGSNMTCVVYEQTDAVGGTWCYTDDTGKDKYGMPIHSSMYKSLRTNLPVEVMSYLDYPIKANRSFVGAKEIFKYLHDYTEHFKLKQHIKFHHHVESVTPKDSGWEVTAVNLETNECETTYFDSVMVCNGHYSSPCIPSLPGLQDFAGKVFHSHEYRCPKLFANERVLIIGGGPSGIDISLDLSQTADTVYFSHHLEYLHNTKYPSNVYQKPDITCMTANSVTFKDGTSHEIDVIVFCTGYDFSFPFLSKECGITVERGKYVHDLYKQMIHIYNPTLCFIGLPSLILPLPVFDLQVQYFLKILSGEKQLPSVEDMLTDTEEYIEKRKAEGFTFKNYHTLGIGRIKPYCDMIAALAGIPLMPPVINKMFEHTINARMESIINYRSINYHVIGDDVFYTTHLEE